VIGKPSCLSKAEVSDAAEWICVELGLSRYHGLFVKIVIRKDLRENQHYDGKCYWIDSLTGSHPRSFTILIDGTMRRPTFLSSLFHEMVHVKQFASGRYPRNASADFEESLLRKCDEIPDSIYRKLPWEVEASSNEKRYLKRYLKGIRIPAERK
jgi:hypothetical protein